MKSEFFLLGFSCRIILVWHFHFFIKEILMEKITLESNQMANWTNVTCPVKE